MPLMEVGHLSAANAIKQYIDTHYKDCNTLMCDCMKYFNPAIEKVTTDAYKNMAKHAPLAWGELYKIFDKKELTDLASFGSKIMSKKIYKLFQEFKPDIVISAHPLSSQMTSILKSEGKTSCILATIMTDFASHNQWLVGNEYVDYYFVANNSMKNELIEKNVSEEKIYVTGIPLSNKFLMHFDREKIKQSFNLNLTKKTILFFVGGEFGLGEKETTSIFKAFTDNLNNKYQMIAISGKNEYMENKLKNIVENEHLNDKVQVYGFTNKVPELMSISDLVVTKPGGLTSSESLASGLPMIIINPIPGQEVQNANFLVSNGVAIWIKKNDDFDSRVSQILSDTKKLENMKLKAKLLAKKNSTKNICEIIMKNYKK